MKLTPTLQELFDINPLFNGLSPEQQSSFAQIIEEKHFEAGDIIVKEGDVDDAIFFIIQGSASVLKTDASHTEAIEHQIATLNCGESIGNLSLIDKESRSATVKALTPLHTLVFKASALHDLDKTPASIESLILINFAKRMSQYLRNTNITTLSERKRHQAEIVQLTNFDVVTGLPNQQLLKDALAADMLENPDETQVLYQCEVSDYKDACDALGQDIGDQFLVTIAERLSTFLTSKDTLYRVGTNQFIVHTRGLNHPEDMPHAAQRILRLFATPFSVDDTEIFSNAYVGVAHYPHDGTHPEALIKHAGLALDTAKLTDPQSFAFYDIHMNKKVEERRLLVTDLHQALVDDQFELFYQPQMHLAQGRLVGAEALIRWTHPARGMVSPAEFIPIVEQTGMIIQLGDWITRMACAQAKMWSQLPTPVRVAINLSAIQFNDKNLVKSLQTVLLQSKLDPTLVELEITEGVMMSNMDETIAKLKRFSDMGFVIAIDDFGTGYSSLSYLRKLPIDKLKIDQSFVRDLDSDKDSRDIIRCIISLAKSLNLEVIAEGIETAENERFLKELGCDEGQGFLYSKPISAGEFEHKFLNQ